MPRLSSLRPVRPRTITVLSPEQREILEKGLSNEENGHLGKAASLFQSLYEQMQSANSEVSQDSACMKANADLVLARLEITRNRDEAEKLFRSTISALEVALKIDPYWADYFNLRGKIVAYLHTDFGCKIVRNRGVWEIKCIDVSNALRIPGISRSETFDLECSICKKDPMFCPHVSGEVYDGRLALGIVRHLEIKELSIITPPHVPEERTIGIWPRPLTDGDIRKLYSEKTARQIIDSGVIRCKDLVRIIRKNNLGGVEWVQH
ncbi:MAG: hypothetical protein ABSA50_12945 [Candidatus Bathyarchaeia archaeon]